jgi:hypothetical protein
MDSRCHAYWVDWLNQLTREALAAYLAA